MLKLQTVRLSSPEDPQTSESDCTVTPLSRETVKRNTDSESQGKTKENRRKPKEKQGKPKKNNRNTGSLASPRECPLSAAPLYRLRKKARTLWRPLWAIYGCLEDSVAGLGLLLGPLGHFFFFFFLLSQHIWVGLLPVRSP